MDFVGDLHIWNPSRPCFRIRFSRETSIDGLLVESWYERVVKWGYPTSYHFFVGIFHEINHPAIGWLVVEPYGKTVRQRAHLVEFRWGPIYLEVEKLDLKGDGNMWTTWMMTFPICSGSMFIYQRVYIYMDIYGDRKCRLMLNISHIRLCLNIVFHIRGIPLDSIYSNSHWEVCSSFRHAHNLGVSWRHHNVEIMVWIGGTIPGFISGIIYWLVVYLPLWK